MNKYCSGESSAEDHQKCILCDNDEPDDNDSHFTTDVINGGIPVVWASNLRRILDIFSALFKSR